MAVLDPPGANDLDLARGTAQGEIESIDAVAAPDLVEQTLGVGRELRRLVEVLGDLVEEVGWSAHGCILLGLGAWRLGGLEAWGLGYT